MNIALFTDGIYPHVIGGMQKHSYYLAKYLAASGVQVDLYHVPGDEEELAGFTDAEKKNINSFVIPFPTLGNSPGHYIRESYDFSIRIYKLMKQSRRPDFIYAKGFTAWETLNQKSKGADLPPVGVNLHGYEMFQKQPSLAAWFKSRLLLRSPALFQVKNADFLFSYGGKITGIIESLGVSKHRILEIPTGISPDWIHAANAKVNQPRRFVFVGRYERRKGIEELSAVIKRMQGTDWEFHFVGPIPSDKKIARPSVVYHGEIRDAEKLRNLLRTMDVLVCPSHSEGMPNVIMEALATGLAIIATDTGATSVMANDQNGWLIPPANESVLEEVMRKAINCTAEELFEKKKAATNLVQEKFSWEKIAIETKAKIETVL
jgi:glycosyltransferase involved in cell wall biosynthesis